MKMRYLPVLLLCAVLLAIPAEAFAACTVNDGGVLYLDSDCDGIIDNTDLSDADSDGVPDGEVVDNCVDARNGKCNLDQLNCDVNVDGSVTAAEMAAGFQLDWNENGAGDACDDSDLDSVVDYLDNCKMVANPTQDPDVCTDTDGDNFEDPIDNCPGSYNPQQEDSDGDGFGDWCDTCRNVPNPTQSPAACAGNGSGTGNQPNPSQSPTNDVVTPGPTEQGEDQLKGNGFGDGGCSLLAVGQPHSPYIAIACLLAALLVLRARRT